ncbi:hypothetical protein E2C01_014774 [Portunus trituberculatus]|uniref:DUF7043 domain-containing protein n=1 Tax=Portunus trituberculatus TaxID=210409 RepID=A0A5B7DL40_PORTR|nr:hypothetical protein [Portunus trituberculatus]
MNPTGPEERLVCTQEREKTSSRVTFVTHVTTGCTSGFICTVFYRRDGHIIEMQQGECAVAGSSSNSPAHWSPLLIQLSILLHLAPLAASLLSGAR